MQDVRHIDISVIIVNYNTAELAIAAAESVLERDHGGRQVEIYLVDNASQGDDAARLSDRFAEEPRVRLLLEQENHGFGRGNNLVLEALADRPDPPEYVFFLNPDAALINDAIDILVTAIETRPQTAAAGPALFWDDGSEGVAAFRFPGLISEFVEGATLSLFKPLQARHSVALGVGLRAQPVDWVSGAALIVRFDVLREVGFFDPGFFLYYEEVDLLARLADAGWACWHVPEARIQHIAGSSTGLTRRDDKPKSMPGYWYDSWRLFFVNRHGRLGATVIALARLGGWSINWLASMIRLRRPDAPKRFAREFLSHVLGPLIFGAHSR